MNNLQINIKRNEKLERLIKLQSIIENTDSSIIIERAVKSCLKEGQNTHTQSNYI